MCFKVCGKMFAVLALDAVPQRLCFKCTPAKFAELVEHEEIIPAPYVGRYKWVLLQRLDALPGAEVKDLVRQSYEMVSAKLPKAKTRKKRPSARTNRKVPR